MFPSTRSSCSCILAQFLLSLASATSIASSVSRSRAISSLLTVIVRACHCLDVTADRSQEKEKDHHSAMEVDDELVDTSSKQQSKTRSDVLIRHTQQQRASSFD